MKCRKCGSQNEQGAWVCRKCEYILDSSFLGADILNEKTRDGVDDPSSASYPMPPADEGLESPFHDFGDDALILGRLGDGEVESFVTDRTGGFMPTASDEQRKAPRSVYVTGEVRMLLLPDAVLRHTADARDRREVLSPFESALFDFIDGKRSLEDVQAAAGLSDNDLCVAVAMLHDKALIEKVPPAPELEDHTKELDDLPPLDAPLQSLERVPSPFDAFTEPPAPRPSPAPVPLRAPAPAPRAPAPSTSPAPRAPAPSPAPAARRVPPPGVPREAPPDVPDPGLTPAMRPAFREALKPAMKPPAAPLKSSSPALASPALRVTPAAKAPAPVSASTAEAKKRAAGYYDICMRELQAGRMGRAWGYAKMAADADPAEEKYQVLLRDWNKLHGAHGDRASTPQELMAAALEAEGRNDFAKAIEILMKLLATAPNSAAAHNKLAVLLATRMKDFRAAYDSAIKAVELEPGNMAYQSNMMKILTRVDEDEKKKGETGDQGLFAKLLRR